MKTIIYTYANMKPVFFELDRYYYIKSEKQLDLLIDKLMDIDAVTSPTELKFPVMLELKSGFSPNLVVADKKAMKSQLVKLQKLVVL
jgi:hypothetical protein